MQSYVWILEIGGALGGWEAQCNTAARLPLFLRELGLFHSSVTHHSDLADALGKQDRGHHGIRSSWEQGIYFHKQSSKNHSLPEVIFKEWGKLSGSWRIALPPPLPHLKINCMKMEIDYYNLGISLSECGYMGSSNVILGEGNGTPLRYYCLETPMDGEAWWATVHGVAKSRTRLSDFTFPFLFF